MSVDKGNGGVYAPGAPLRLCYSLTPPDPFTVRLYKRPAGAPEQLFTQFNDSGSGDCIDTTLSTSELGRKDYRAQFVVNGTVVAEATAWVTVQAGGSFSFEGTLAGTPGHVGPGESAPIQWTSSQSPLELCYRLSPSGVAFGVRVSMTPGTYYANNWRTLTSFNDNGVGGGGCVSLTATIGNGFPQGACYATMKVEAIVQGSTVGEITFAINRHFGC
jgi:hypothetical protein